MNVLWQPFKKSIIDVLVAAQLQLSYPRCSAIWKSTAFMLLMMASFVRNGAVAQSVCQQQYLNFIYQTGKNSSASMVDFIDPDTPASECIISLCQETYSKCDPSQSSVPKIDLVLVFSDEFEAPDRRFASADKDKRWTAEDIYYFPTQDLEVYKPDQVTTWAGKAVITIERADPSESAITYQPTGEKWDVPKNFTSGMVNSWNKWCYTGGYLEMKAKLPGNVQVPGFWPAFWTMGNLGRAGYMKSTSGLWPYSYNYCGDGTNVNNSIPGSKVSSQKITGCPPDPLSPDYIDVTQYDMVPGFGRGAPEFDVFEGKVGSSGGEVSQTLQMAPLIPEGQTYTDMSFYSSNGLSPGVHYPGGSTKFNTRPNSWSGTYNRPGNEYQDSISAITSLSESFYSDFHTFGVDWSPGEYLRWYIDGKFLYEINANALAPRSGEMDGVMYNIGPRMIPFEPMYIIFNVGMSYDFSEVDLANLPFPSQMLIEYIRVYQRPDQINVGCNPPDYPTEKWIACHKDEYTLNSQDNYLFGSCKSDAEKSARAHVGMLLVAILFLIITT